MCIAILNTGKKGGEISRKSIKNSWASNPDGGGLMWAEDGLVNHFKTYEMDEMINKYRELRKSPNIGNIVLHFRIATSGFDGKDNLHPFLVNDSLGFVHNGIISGLGNDSISDTREFNEILKMFNHDFIKCAASRMMIARFIGTGSKLVFLDGEDNYEIINESAGHWRDGNWYSNNSYCDRVVYSGGRGLDNWDYTKSYMKKPVVKNSKPKANQNQPSYWDVRNQICEMLDISPKSKDADDVIYIEMQSFNCIDIYELHDVLEYYGYGKSSL